MEYDNKNRFVLFKNEKKTSDKHPNMTGTLDVNGIEYWISAWTKEGKNGKFISGSIKLKEETRQSSEPTRKTVDESDMDW